MLIYKPPVEIFDQFETYLVHCGFYEEISESLLHCDGVVCSGKAARTFHAD